MKTIPPVPSPSSSTTPTTRHQVLSAEDLVPNPWNPNRMTAAMFDKLDESIATYGLVDPLTVRRIVVGDPELNIVKWQIIDGEHRFSVAVARGHTKFDCMVIDGLSDAQAKKLTIIMNELHGQADPGRMGDLLNEILADTSLDELLVALPYDESVLAGYLSLDSLPPLAPVAPRPEPGVSSDKQVWVERLYRMPKEVALVIDEAIEKASDGEGIESWQALERVAAEYLAS